jgi:polar amino acid transport system substrate-binding protein
MFRPNVRSDCGAALLRRRLVALTVFAALTPVMPSIGAEPLTLGRQAEESLVSDISQRIVTEAFARAGVPMVFRRLPLPRSLEAANDGEIDGDLHRIADVVSRFPNLVQVPTPINRIDIVVYGGSPAIEKLSRADIQKLRFAYPRGTVALVKHSRGMQATEAATRAGAIEMMINGRVDAVLGVYSDIEPSVLDGSLAGLYLWPRVWASEALYLTLNRRHAALVPRIDAVVRQMKQEGKIEQYYADGLRSVKIKPLPRDPDARPAPTPAR